MAQNGVILEKAILVDDTWYIPNDKNNNEYYYLPTKIEISESPTGKMYHLIKYKSYDQADDPIAGAAFDILLSIAPSEKSLKLAENKLRKYLGSSETHVIGMAPIENLKVKMTSLSLLSEEEIEMVSEVKDLNSNSQIAYSLKLDKDQATLLDNYLQNKSGDLSFEMDYTIPAKFPYFSGKIKYNWDEIEDDPITKEIEDKWVSPEIAEKYLKYMISNYNIDVEAVGKDGTFDNVIDKLLVYIAQQMFESRENPEPIYTVSKSRDIYGLMYHKKEVKLIPIQRFKNSNIEIEKSSTTDIQYTYSTGLKQLLADDDVSKHISYSDLKDPQVNRKNLKIYLSAKVDPEITKYFNEVSFHIDDSLTGESFTTPINLDTTITELSTIKNLDNSKIYFTASTKDGKLLMSSNCKIGPDNTILLDLSLNLQPIILILDNSLQDKSEIYKVRATVSTPIWESDKQEYIKETSEIPYKEFHEGSYTLENQLYNPNQENEYLIEVFYKDNNHTSKTYKTKDLYININQ